MWKACFNDTFSGHAWMKRRIERVVTSCHDLRYFCPSQIRGRSASLIRASMHVLPFPVLSQRTMLIDGRVPAGMSKAKRDRSESSPRVSSMLHSVYVELQLFADPHWLEKRLFFISIYCASFSSTPAINQKMQRYTNFSCEIAWVQFWWLGRLLSWIIHDHYAGRSIFSSSVVHSGSLYVKYSNACQMYFYLFLYLFH